MSWVQRVEAVLGVLRGSSIEEIELAEGELEIVVRRCPSNGVATGTYQRVVQQRDIPLPLPAGRTLDMLSPFTGVYYAGPAPTEPPFVNVGDTIAIGQTIALIEAMKVFSEIPSEVAGRVVAISVHNGDVVKKGDVLLQVEAI